MADKPSCCIPPGPKRGRTCRGRERHGHLPLGRRSVDRLPEMASELARQATVIVTSGGPPGIRGQSGHDDHPHRFSGRRRPDPARSRHQPRAPQRQSPGDQYVGQRIGGQAVELLHQLVPQAQRIAVLVNPGSVARRRRPYGTSRRQLPRSACNCRCSRRKLLVRSRKRLHGTTGRGRTPFSLEALPS